MVGERDVRVVLLRAALEGERPSDGYFVEFWRLLVEWPEIIAWNRLFDQGKHQVLAEVGLGGQFPILQLGMSYPTDVELVAEFAVKVVK